jgi:hypothetical protein
MLKIRDKTKIKNANYVGKHLLGKKIIMKMQQSKNKTLEVSISSVHGKNNLQAFKVL